MFGWFLLYVYYAGKWREPQNVVLWRFPPFLWQDGPACGEREQQNGCASAVVQRLGSPHDRTVGMLHADAVASLELH